MPPVEMAKIILLDQKYKKIAFFTTKPHKSVARYHENLLVKSLPFSGFKCRKLPFNGGLGVRRDESRIRHFLSFTNAIYAVFELVSKVVGRSISHHHLIIHAVATSYSVFYCCGDWRKRFSFFLVFRHEINYNATF